MGLFGKYLFIINFIGLVAYLINMILYTYTENGNIDTILTIIAIIGGSLGIFISIMFFDRKSVKENMMSRVFVICVCVIQIIIILLLKDFPSDQVDFAFWKYFGKHKILIVYLIVINFATFVAFAIDKINAIEQRSRIRIVTLLGMAFAGGSLGAILGMYILRHKIRVDYFTVGVPLIIITQILVIFYLMNFC